MIFQKFWLHPVCPFFLSGCKIKFNSILLKFRKQTLRITSTFASTSFILYINPVETNKYKIQTDDKNHLRKYTPRNWFFSVVFLVSKINKEAQIVMS